MKDTEFSKKLFVELIKENAVIQPLAVTLDKKTKTSIIKNINLRADGKFIDDWPDGFFEERYKEKGLL